MYVLFVLHSSFLHSICIVQCDDGPIMAAFACDHGHHYTESSTLTSICRWRFLSWSLINFRFRFIRSLHHRSISSMISRLIAAYSFIYWSLLNALQSMCISWLQQTLDMMNGMVDVKLYDVPKAYSIHAMHECGRCVFRLSLSNVIVSLLFYNSFF